LIDHLNPLRLGCVQYLNARPLIFGWPGKVRFDHPSNLCRALAQGELDVALVSSFEFLRNPIYRVIDDISIASDGAVYSVVIAHQTPVADLKQIELDPAAETSVALVHCLLAEQGLNPEFVRSFKAAVGPDAGRLLIGDQAINFRQRHAHDFNFWDLGDQWKKLTGLPFVYALWLVRPEIANAAQIAGELRSLAAINLRQLDKIVAHLPDPDFCMRYYREYLRFTFGTKQEAGLQRFQELCAKHGLIPFREFKLDLV
jgi:predicted solute-binding protein